jgi:hypothetical protein
VLLTGEFGKATDNAPMLSSWLLSMLLVDGSRFLVDVPASDRFTSTRRGLLVFARLVLYFVAPVVAFGLLSGEWATGLLFAAPIWLLYGFRAAFRSPGTDIRLADELRWSWRRSLVAVGVSAALVMLYTFFWSAVDIAPFGGGGSYYGNLLDNLALLFSSPRLFADTVFPHQEADRWFMALVLATGGFIGGWQPSIANAAVMPHEGLRRTIFRAARSGLAASVVLTSLALLPIDLDIPKVRSIFNFVGVFCLGALAFGGVDLIRHGVLRLILAGQRKQPLRALHTLQEETALVFLYRAGGGFLFIHRMLLEYFSDEPRPST